MEELRRQLEEAKQQLQEITVHIDLQSQKNDESQSNERWAFPKLRSIAWNMMKFGIPTLIIFSIFFVMIWYMMTQYSSA
jgi:ATP-dependent Zn protease